MLHQGHGVELFCVGTQNASVSLQCQITVQGLEVLLINTTTFSGSHSSVLFSVPSASAVFPAPFWIY